MTNKNPRRGEQHPFWKGDDAGYFSMHKWLDKYGGKTGICERCGRKGTEWANLSGTYRRDRSDWLELCRSCHRTMDKAIDNLAAAPFRPVKCEPGCTCRRHRKLSEYERQEIAVRHASGVSQPVLATQFGCSVKSISRVIKLVTSP